MNLKERMRSFLILAVAVFTLAFACQVSAKDIVLVLDPGHGGAESGACRGKYKEEVITHKIAKYLKSELDTYRGIQVYSTRADVSQEEMNREERVNIAKVKKADALVSLHINSAGYASQTRVSGSLAMVPSNKYTNTSANKARALANCILASLSSNVGTKNLGFLYDDELGIIHFAQKKNYTTAQANKLGIPKSVLNVTLPSMIIEHAFIDNPNDCSKYLSSDEKIKKLAIADAKGIAKYFNLSKKTEEPTKPEHTGLVKIGSAWYLFDEYGNPVEGLEKYNGKYYYGGTGGKLIKGWKTIGDKRYYFGKTTYAGLNGLYKIGKYKYFFKNGYYQKKWVTYNNKQYYFSKVNGHMLKNYWLKWEGNWYYLNSNGNPWKSCTKKIKGKKYRFNAQGICTNKK